MRLNSFGVRTILFAVVGAFLLGSGTLVYGQDLGRRQKVERLVVDVLVDFSTFDQVPSSQCTGCGPFYVGGTVLDHKTGEELGRFNCWGWFFSPDDDVVNQEYNIGRRGKLIVAGTEDAGRRAVTGGTGDFRNVRGEATGFDFSALGTSGQFTATFRLLR